MPASGKATGAMRLREPVLQVVSAAGTIKRVALSPRIALLKLWTVAIVPTGGKSKPHTAKSLRALKNKSR